VSQNGGASRARYSRSLASSVAVERSPVDRRPAPVVAIEHASPVRDDTSSANILQSRTVAAEPLGQRGLLCDLSSAKRTRVVVRVCVLHPSENFINRGVVLRLEEE